MITSSVLIVFSTLGAAVAAWLLVPSGGLPSPAPTRPDFTRPGRRTSAAGVRIGIIGLAVVVVMVTTTTSGPAAGAVATAAAMVAATSAVLVSRQLAVRRTERYARQVAQACAAVAAQVVVGRIPTEALVSAAEDHRVLRVPARTLGLGGDVVEALRAEARRPGGAGMAAFAQAWQFSQSSGAPMAAVLDQVAAALRDDQATRRTVAAELAGPRASGVVMAALPAVGIGLGYLIGGDPIGFLLAGPAGWGCLVSGTALALAGVIWMDRLARDSEQDGGEVGGTEQDSGAG